MRLAAMLEPEDNNFGLIRLGLALAVLVSHMFYLKSGQASAEPLTRWTGHSLGEHAVQIFFFLSGLMVAQSADRSASLLRFAVARSRRIFPGLIVCVLVTAFVLGPFVTALDAASYITAPGLPSYIVKTVLLTTGLAPLPGVFSNVPAAGVVNMSLWTLKYEVFCYVGLAVAAGAGIFRPSRGMWPAVLLSLFMVLIFLKSRNGTEPYTATENIRYFALFFATGVLAYLIRNDLPLHGALLAGLAVCYWLALGTRVSELAAAAFLGYAALIAAALPLGALRACANRCDLSFGVYIYACPIQQLIVERAPDLSVAQQIIVAVAIVMPLAFASWNFVERPALMKRNRVSDRLGRWAGRTGFAAPRSS